MRHKHRRAIRQKETLLISKGKMAEKFFLVFSIYRHLPDEFCGFSSPSTIQTLYCGPVLRQPTALIQAAKGSSAMFALATESCSALT
jgi:hypothetical protein